MFVAQQKPVLPTAYVSPPPVPEFKKRKKKHPKNHDFNNILVKDKKVEKYLATQLNESVEVYNLEKKIFCIVAVIVSVIVLSIPFILMYKKKQYKNKKFIKDNSNEALLKQDNVTGSFSGGVSGVVGGSYAGNSIGNTFAGGIGQNISQPTAYQSISQTYSPQDYSSQHVSFNVPHQNSIPFNSQSMGVNDYDE